MGRPKATLKFGSSTILEHLISELAGGFGEILLIGAPAQSEDFSIATLVQNMPLVRLFRDEQPHQGAATALVRGLHAMRSEAAFVCSCDLPLLRMELVLGLQAMLKDYEAVIPAIGGLAQPLLAFYRRSAAVSIESALASGERRLVRIVTGLRAYRPAEAELRRFDPDLRSFLNVNTPEDYHRACILKFGSNIRES
jgi:molybdopterin-guanine dinucleotide biosynthesis protein A